MKNTNHNNNETLTAMTKFEIIELVKDNFEGTDSEFQKRYSEEVTDFIKENSISDEDLKKLNSILETEGLSYSEMVNFRDELSEKMDHFYYISERNYDIDSIEDELNELMESDGLDLDELEKLAAKTRATIDEFDEALSKIDFDKDTQIVLDTEGLDGAIHEIIYQMGALLQDIDIDWEEDEEDFDPIDEYLSKAIENAAEICKN